MGALGVKHKHLVDICIHNTKNSVMMGGGNLKMASLEREESVRREFGKELTL